jgi:hypothetical protein
MTHDFSTFSRENSFKESTPTLGGYDELMEELLFTESIDDLLASGEIQVDDLPFDEPKLSEESLAFLSAQAAEIPTLIARGELIEIIADDF